MTIEYVMLLVCVMAIALKSFFSAPREAFMNAGPKLGARVEKHLVTGQDFVRNHELRWVSDGGD